MEPYRAVISAPETAEHERIRLELSRELALEEELVWSGRPRQGVYFRPTDAFQIPFMIFWTGFAVFWEANAIRTGVVFMMLWGVPFVCVGLYMLIGRFFYQAWLNDRTFYGITNRRAIIVTAGRTRSLVEIDLLGTNIASEERRNGSGTIMFGTAKFEPYNRRGSPVLPGFEAVDDVRAVMSVIRDVKEKARAPMV